MLPSRKAGPPLGRQRVAIPRAARPKRTPENAEGIEPRPVPKRSLEVIRIYLRDIGRLKLLSRAEEIDLGRRVRRGDDIARERMILGNLRLVVKIAGDFSDMGVPLLDLISEGNIGLMKAVDRFDPENGAKFSSYAAWWIKQHIRRALSNQSRTIRLPVYVQDKLFQVHKVQARLTERLGRAPSDEELAAEVSMKPARLARLRDASRHTCALDAPILDNPAEGTFQDMVADDQQLRPDHALLAQTSRQHLARFMTDLTRRELLVLQRRYGLDDQQTMTLEEIGRELGLTRERVRQIQMSVLAKLRRRFDECDEKQ